MSAKERQNDLGGETIAEDKQTLLPSIAHLQSDDSLFGESKSGFGDQSRMQQHPQTNKAGGKVTMQGVHKVSTRTERMNATEFTAPQTSKNT